MDAKVQGGPSGPMTRPGPGGPGFGGPGMGGRPGMRGGRDLTTGPILQTLVMFSLPVLGGNVLQSLNGTVNQFWVGHTLGESAIAALSNANLIMMLMMGAVFGVSMSANILVAQAVGAGNMALVKRVMGTAIVFFIALSVTVATAGMTFAPHILDLMGTPPEAKVEAIAYLRIVFGAMPFMYFFAFLQMAQRGAGDSRTPLYFMTLAVVLDVILNPLLIRGIGPFPRLGIAGSATSTLIGQGVSLVCLVIYLYRRHSVLMLRPGEFHLLKPDWDVMRQMMFRGIPMGIQMFVMSGTAIVMMGFVNSYGAMTTAGYAAASQVWTYLQMPVMALGASISSMAGQNIGANRWDRVERIALSGLGVGLVITSAIALLIYATNSIILHVFLPEHSPALIIARHINNEVMWSFVLFSVTFSLQGVVRASGAVWTPLIILVISMVVIRVPFAILLQPHIGADAVWWSFPLGTITSAAMTILYYRYGGWRNLRMLNLDDANGTAGDTGQSTPAMDPPEADDLAAEAVESGRVSTVDAAEAAR